MQFALHPAKRRGANKISRMHFRKPVLQLPVCHVLDVVPKVCRCTPIKLLRAIYAVDSELLACSAHSLGCCLLQLAMVAVTVSLPAQPDQRVLMSVHQTEYEGTSCE
jgi:hypothetical protein